MAELLSAPTPVTGARKETGVPGTHSMSEVELLCINTIRTLAMDAVQQANSGHPGAPMALAPLAYVLYRDILRHDPEHPDFPNRDRLVLSNGHASMLLYATLFLSGYDVTLDDIKQFRQLKGRCAGHPEYGLLPGIETTTGPLGQGAGNSVGLAMAERWLAGYFNRPGFEIVGHRTFAILGDGCMMEGVTHEAASLAGHLRLGRLVWIYDDNRITIDGGTDLALSENMQQRFASYSWNTLKVDDVNDLSRVRDALEKSCGPGDRPTLIIMRTHIAYGSPAKQDTSAAHGAPLGADEIHATKKAYGWDPHSSFEVPATAQEHLSQSCRQRGESIYQAWSDQFKKYESSWPQLAEEWRSLQLRGLPLNWEKDLPQFDEGSKPIATRGASGKCLAHFAKSVPWLLGGSADLAESTNTLLHGEVDFGPPDYRGRNIRFGVREHAMGAVANGLALSNLRPFVGTFLVFSDYMRPTIRLAALMGLPVTYVFTHDSIGLGEDGPTHQPIEHLAALRAIPDLDVIRPADARETADAWEYAMSVIDRPVALVLSRQALPILKQTAGTVANGLQNGGYVLMEGGEEPDVILIATGSEVALCVQAAEKMSHEGIEARVVSMPCWSLFTRQPESYRHQVLPPSVRARVAVEAASTLGWERFVGLDGRIIGMERFGASAPASQLFETFGFTVDHVIAEARTAIEQAGGE